MGRFAGVELDDLELRTDRLTLRPWRPDDAAAVTAAMADRSMFRFLTLPDPYTRADAEAFVGGLGQEGRGEGTGIGAAMEDASGTVVGAIGIRLARARVAGSTASASAGADIGYWVAPWGRGNGYAAEAARCLADWAHAHGVHRVEIRCAVQNLASARTALRAGFALETVLREEGPTPSGPADHAVFARFPDSPAEPRWPGFPPLGELTDGVVRLRPLDDRDADPLVEQELDPVSLQWSLSDPPDEARLRRGVVRAPLNWITGTSMHVAILDAASGAFAGHVELHLFGPPAVGLIGYMVHPAWRGRGYAARALRLFAPWLFEVAEFARLELGAKVDNVASRKTALAGGFRPEGISAGRLRNPDGTFSDEARFYLLPRSARQ